MGMGLWELAAGCGGCCRAYHSYADGRPDLGGAVSEVPQEEPHSPVSFGCHLLSMVSRQEVICDSYPQVFAGAHHH